MNAELHASFVWDCDNCGRENFVRAIEANLDEGAAQSIADSQISQHFETVDPGDGAEEVPYLITRTAIAPARVTCKGCGRTFETELPHEENQA